MKKRGTWWRKAKWASLAVFALAIAAAHAASEPGRACLRVELEGKVSEGQEWKTALGGGWTFRVLPITGYSGWDLAVDRDSPAGYPDALLVATLPYNSINEREIGTTYGLRAQDAIGWNPRSFRFLTNPTDFRQAQSLFRQFAGGGANANPRAAKPETSGIKERLLELERGASSGQFRILDARLVPGIGDPQPFAQDWAFAFSRTQHQIEPVAAGQASQQGRLVWMRFAVTFWLPVGWKLPSGIKYIRVSCPE